MDEKDNEIWIFLSHSNEDYEKVRRVRNFLEEMNTRPLMFFLKCLNDNDEIEDLIKREIEARTRFILCDSENARKSNWVTKEIEYIEELRKPYHVIDITADESSILDSLKIRMRKEQIFISFSDDLLPAIEIIRERLSKYDFSSFFIAEFDDSNDAAHLDDFNARIKNAVSKGYFIPLLSRQSPQSSRYNQLAIETALKYETNYKSILPIYLDKGSKNQFHEQLKDYDTIDLTNNYTPHNGNTNSKDIPYRYGNLGSIDDLKQLGDDITHAILVRLQGWGNIHTYAENFRFGQGLKQDVDEADKLGKLVVEDLEAIDNSAFTHSPGMLISLGNLFKSGKVVKRDYAKALQYYRNAHREYGITIDVLISGIPPEFL